MKMFTTNEDFQEEVEVQVFEGERPFTKAGCERREIDCRTTTNSPRLF